MHNSQTTSAPRRARTSLSIVAVLVGAVLLVGCGSVKPFMKHEWSRADNAPNTVEGSVNGLLSDAHLEQLTATCKLEKKAAASLKEMLHDAWKDGVALAPGSCYRDLAGQLNVRSRWCGAGHCNMAARPGTSNHGWGRAIDFRDQDGGLTFTSKGYIWLRWHGFQYGWNHPGWAFETGSAPEAWHWEWVGDGGTLFPGGSDTPVPGTPAAPEVPTPGERPPTGVDQGEAPPAPPPPAPRVVEPAPVPAPAPAPAPDTSPPATADQPPATTPAVDDPPPPPTTEAPAPTVTTSPEADSQPAPSASEDAPADQ